MTTTTIIVLFGDKPIGAIQSLTTITNDGYTNPTLKSFRMRLDKTRMSEVFSRGFVHVAAQKYPVQIVIVEDKREIQKIHNAWFTSIEHTFTTGDWVILEEAVLEAEKITDYGMTVSTILP
jgi:hypothetical protein